MNGKVKFISYNGEYPNLCSGILVLDVDGKRFELERALISGGSVWFDEDWSENVEQGAWEIGMLPEELEMYRVEIQDIVNENVFYGCCGGCV